MIRQSLQLGALFQVLAAAAFGAGAPLWRLATDAQPLFPSGYFASLGALVASAAVLLGLGRIPAARRERGAGVALAVLAVLLPLADLELGLRPFVEPGGKQTDLFVSDPELGWRLRPGANALWGNVPVEVNAHGLRGPLVPHERRQASLRILYLGDSVTFGYKLPDYAQSFPYQAEPLLEEHFGVDVETVNAGVGGYSPWQELAYLRKEGVRYSPDLVVVGFVLNDVTEKMDLRSFGGRGIGAQLNASYYSALDRLAHRSALVHSGRALYARLRFGPDLRAGAVRHETLNVRDLIHDFASPRIQAAWRITLENLDGIFELCRRHEIPVALVAFPYLAQFTSAAKLDRPQRKLAEHARRRGVPMLDLLRPMAEISWETRRSPARFFFDANHLTPLGSQVVARLLRDFLAAHCRDLLPDHCPGRTPAQPPAPAGSEAAGRRMGSNAISASRFVASPSR
jgi:lysophospholipase L1-like esterase